MMKRNNLFMFAENLKFLREKHGLTQRELAKSLTVSASTIAMWETGRREPDFATIISLAEYFGTTTSYLLGETDDSALPSSQALAEDPLLKDELIALYGDVKKTLSEDDIEDIKLFIRMKNERKKAKEQSNDKHTGEGL